MQKPKYTPEEEQLLMSQLWSPMIVDDPEAFVMFVYPWGQEGTPLARFKHPRKWQRKVLREVTESIRERNASKINRVFRKAIKSGRGPGKSALLSWLAHWFITTRIGGSVIVSANTETQLRSITWPEITKWVKMSLHSHWFETVGIRLTPARWLRDLVERDLKKSTDHWEVEGRLWSEDNPDAYAGAHNFDGMMVIFDEASGIADGIWSVANGFFTEDIPDRYWFAFGNPRRNQGYFFECFNSKRDFWSTDTIDSRTVENVDPKVYQDIIDEYGEDSDEARIEVYGEFPNSGDESFISPVLVKSAVGREVQKDPTAPILIGVDPARGGSDWFIILIRQGRSIVDIKQFKIDVNDDAIGTMEGVGHVIDAIHEYNPDLVIIDETGLGGPILDRLKEQRYRQVRGVNFAWKAKDSKRWGNKRAEMWGEMKKWLATGSIPNNKRLITDLSAPRKKPDSSGKIFLESKKEMKARGVDSPDIADALAVTFAFPVANREVEEIDTKIREEYVEFGYMGKLSSNSWMGA